MAKRSRLSLPILAIFSSLAALVFGSTLLYQGQYPVIPALLTGEYERGNTQGEFHGQQLTSSVIAEAPRPPKVLGVNDQKKHIEVDLSAQRLYAYEGDQLVYNFLISSGKWGRTPTGTFHIWGKFRYTKMSGGSRALHTYYYLPNVPFVMFFSNDEIAPGRGFSLHGTYWHDNFGHPMSHGCVNMKTEEAEKIFYWSEPDIGDSKSGRADEDHPGTEIVIYGVAPQE